MSRGPSTILREGLSLLEVPGGEPAAVRLESYMDELERWNPRFGLVKYEDREELVVRHVLDSLSAWGAVRDAAGSGAGAVLDVGSGAGLPGIPLAVALPAFTFTLLERMERRAAFLRACALLLGLRNVTVLRRGLDEIEGRFDVVTFRAFAPLDRFLAECERSGPSWGTIVAFKGRPDRAEEEIAAAGDLAGRGISASVVPLAPPFQAEERCLAILSRRPRTDAH